MSDPPPEAIAAAVQGSFTTNRRSRTWDLLFKYSLIVCLALAMITLVHCSRMVPIVDAAHPRLTFSRPRSTVPSA